MAYQAPPLQQTNGMAVASLVLGLVGSVLGLIPLLGFLAIICGILAVTFGFVGRRNAKGGAAPNAGMALAGLILGALAITLGIIGMIILVNATNELEHDLNQINSRFQRRFGN